MFGLVNSRHIMQTWLRTQPSLLLSSRECGDGPLTVFYHFVLLCDLPTNALSMRLQKMSEATLQRFQRLRSESE